MYTALNVSTVTDEVGTYGTDSAIWSAAQIPQDYNGDGINFYLNDPYDARLDIGIYSYTINCRSSSEPQSHAIANAVLTAVNRKSDSGINISCTVQQTLPPADDSDDYNTIVIATLKTRN